MEKKVDGKRENKNKDKYWFFTREKKKKVGVTRMTLNLGHSISHEFDKGTKDILIDLVRNLDRRLYNQLNLHGGPKE